MIYTIQSIYAKNCITKISDSKRLFDRWVIAVCMRYPDTIISRLKATYAVLTGKAVAMKWPEPGDLEAAIDRQLL